MAVLDHPVFRQPNNNEARLWRYMDFTKFVSLLVTKKLYFSRADRFEDPFEGSYPQMNVRSRVEPYENAPQITESMRKETAALRSSLARRFREWTYVSCWHANEQESAAMWKLYAQTNEAVAIESNYQTLAEVLPDNVFLGLVNYIDYESEWLPEGNSFYPFMHKRKSFEHEREVRAVVQEYPINESIFSVDLQNPNLGLQINIDLSKLVKYVHVSPTAPEWFEDLVRETSNQFGFSFEVRKSSLNSEPVF
jgi:hypothetical protein